MAHTWCYNQNDGYIHTAHFLEGNSLLTERIKPSGLNKVSQSSPGSKWQLTMSGGQAILYNTFPTLEDHGPIEISDDKKQLTFSPQGLRLKLTMVPCDTKFPPLSALPPGQSF